jgi:hypothetical protein
MFRYYNNQCVSMFLNILHHMLSDVENLGLFFIGRN